MPIVILKSVWKSDSNQLRNATIGSKTSNMLENASQTIACYLMHRRGFSIFCRGCAASQRVAGPYDCGLQCLVV